MRVCTLGDLALDVIVRLAMLHERSGGETLRVNRDLIVDNARPAVEISVAFAAP